MRSWGRTRRTPTLRLEIVATRSRLRIACLRSSLTAGPVHKQSVRCRNSMRSLFSFSDLNHSVNGQTRPRLALRGIYVQGSGILLVFMKRHPRVPEYVCKTDETRPNAFIHACCCRCVAPPLRSPVCVEREQLGHEGNHSGKASMAKAFPYGFDLHCCNSLLDAHPHN